MSHWVLIAGYYGFGNTGDEAILEVILEDLRDLIPNGVFSVISFNPRQTESRYSVEAINWLDCVEIVKAIHRSDIVILGGGGLFHDYMGVDLERVFHPSEVGFESIIFVPIIAHALNKPIMLYAVGVGPLITIEGKIMTWTVFEQAHVSTVRDDLSKKILMALGVPANKVYITADPAFAIQPAENDQIQYILENEIVMENMHPLLGVALRTWDFDVANEEWINEVAFALDRFLYEVGGTVVFIPFQIGDVLKPNDISVAHLVTTHMRYSRKTAILQNEYSPTEIAGLVANCDILLGMRLHSLIFALKSRVPSVALSYDPKVEGLMRELDREEHVLDLKGLKGETLADLLIRVLRSDYEAMRVPDSVINGLVEAAHLNAQFAVELLNISSRNKSKPSYFLWSINGLEGERAALIDGFDGKGESITSTVTTIQERANDYLAEINYKNLRKSNIVPRGLFGDRNLLIDKDSSNEQYFNEFISIVDQNAKSKGIVIYPPTIDWGYMFQRPHQIARSFAKQDYLFFFCTGNASTDNVHGFEYVEQHLYLCNVPLNTFQSVVNPIIYIGTSRHRDFVNYFKNPTVIYDYCDALEISMGTEDDHRFLLRSSEIVLTSARKLMKDVTKHRHDAMLIPNAVDYERIQQAKVLLQKEIPSEWLSILETGHPVIGYSGALAEWLDYNLIRRIAMERRDCELVLIGVDYDGSLKNSRILDEPNVHWFGMKPYDELIKFLWLFDIAIIPFKINNITLSTSPIKLYEYMACGKPVVATAIPECEGYKAVFIANDCKAFLNLIEKAFEYCNDSNVITHLQRVSSLNTWDARVRRVIQRLDEVSSTKGIYISIPSMSKFKVERHGSVIQKLVENFHAAKEQEAKANQNLFDVSKRVEKFKEELYRVSEILSQTKVDLSQALVDIARIKSSRGWKWLNHAWRIVWLIREHTKWLHIGSGLLRGLTSRISNLIYGVAGSFRRRARIFLPMPLRALLFSLHASRITIEDNSQVILYTDRDDLFTSYKQRRPLSGIIKQKVRVSLVSTVLNEIDTAEAWLRTLENQTRQPDEVIIIDAGSTDGTHEILKAFAEQSSLNAKVVVEKGANIAQGRNKGIRLAKNEVIAIADFGSDLTTDYLANIIRPFEIDHNTEVVAGWFEAKTSSWFSERARNEIIPKLADIDPQKFLPSARSMAFLKSVWGAAGNYPEWLTLTGDDTYFALKLKRNCRHWAFVPEAVVVWHAPDTLKSLWNKLASWSAGDGESNLYAEHYWRRSLVLGLTGIVSAMLCIAAALSVFILVSPLVAVKLIVTAFLLFGMITLILVTLIGWETNLGIRILGQLARSIGFFRGVARRPVVTARRHTGATGIAFILSGIPIDDTGGGARAAQLAKELLRRDNLVVFIYKFAKQESIDLQIKNWHPRLLHVHVSDFDWKAFQWEYGELLKHKPILAIAEFPLREFQPLIKSIKRAGGKIVYDLIDDWETSLGGRWYSKTIERKIIDQSDLLIATAPKLVNKLGHVRGREARLIPNAVDLHLFNRRQSYERPKDLPKGNPIFIYVGALWGDWFDWSLLGRVAKAYPEAKIVIIGDYRDKCPLDLPNVHFLGLKAQVDLPAYLIHSDVGIVPWKVDQISQATSPLKVYEYLAMGLPVVAPSLMPLADIPFIFRASSHDEFVAFINKARELQINEEKLDAFLKSNSWQVRMEKIIEWTF